MATIAWGSVKGEEVKQCAGNAGRTKQSPLTVSVTLASRGCTHEPIKKNLDMQELWAGQLAIPGELPSGAQVGEQPEPIQPATAVAAEPEPAYLPTQQAAETEGAKAVICSIFTDDCSKALRVAQCESTDYYAPNYGIGGALYSGTYQIAPIHAGRFSKYGYDYWTQGDNILANTLVAKELRDERQGGSWIGGLWPVCGYS